MGDQNALDMCERYADLLHVAAGDDATPADVARLLMTRQQIASALQNGSVECVIDPERLSALDLKLKTMRTRLVRRAGPHAFERWRDCLGTAPTVSWWWRMDEEKGWRAMANRLITITAWAAVAVALSAVIEIVRRVLPSTSDVYSTVLQGFLGLLVAGTFVEFVRTQVTTGRWRPHVAVSLAAALIVLAFGANFAGTWLAAADSERGIDLKKAKRFDAAILSLQRAVRLAPNDPIANANLGAAQAAVNNFDDAEVAYRNAIRYATADAYPYFGLARMVMAREQDWNQGLSLVARGEEAIGRMNDVSPVDRKALQYAAQRLAAWGYVGLGLTKLAEDRLNTAITLDPSRPAAYCLRARLWAKTDPAASLRAAGQCVGLSFGANDVEPSWVAAAQEYMVCREKGNACEFGSF